LTLVGCGDARLDFSSLTSRNDEANRRDAQAPSNQADADAPAPIVPTADAASTSAFTSHVNALPDAGGPLTDAPVAPFDPEPELLFDGSPLFSDYVRLTHQQWENSVVANLRLEGSTRRD
jgi:hypothetical protein